MPASLPQSTPEWAAAYADLGLRPLVVYGMRDGACTCSQGADCPSPGKHPRGLEWGDFLPEDGEAARGWFEAYPGCNLGLALGPRGKIIDVEHDDEQGEQTAARLLGKSPTWTYFSERSTHRLYAWRDLGLGKAVAKAEGLEVRLGASGKMLQSVAPPSTHRSGFRYRWAEGLSPFEADLAPLPECVEALAKGDGQIAVASAEGLVVEADLELATHPGAKAGERNSLFCRLLGSHVARHGIGPELHQLAADWAGRCSPPWPLREMQKTLVGILEREQGKRQRKASASSSAAISARRYNDIEQREVAWLWQGRIPLGKLSLIAGQPGVGKTFLAADIAACVSRGEAFCDGAWAPQGEVGILSYEDDAGDTLKPRLVAAGADCQRVHHIDGLIDAQGREANVSLESHLEALDEWLAATPELRLLVIDPITAAMGRVDGNSNTDIRGILGPVAKLAERHGLAVVGITHLAKGDRKAIHAVLGSIAFVAAARVVWLVGRDPADDQRRLLLPIKNNLADASGLAYRIVEGRLEWEAGEVTMSADEIDGPGETPRDEVRDWLQGFLENGPQPAEAILAKSRSIGFCERTLRRAKRDLCVVSRKGTGGWVWALPDAANEAGDADNVIFRF